MADILHQVTINAPPESVYEAITTQVGLTAWWTRDTQALAKVGSVACFAFNKRAVLFRMKIAQLAPHIRVRWQCLGDNSEWKGTSLTFDLTPTSDGTVVRFAHRGWKSTQGILAMCSYDWANYLRSLKAYVETGQGMPHSE